ncbi:MAG: hypothetical protein LUC47_10035 [Clostridiales bacterium]|nr:hypothetical protein [Clostridiales bacterium]
MTKLLTPLYILIATVFCSASVLLFPVYWEALSAEPLCIFKSIFLSIYHTLCLFFLNGDYTFLTEQVPRTCGFLYNAYTVYIAILFVAAPLLTFSLVLSLFQNIFAMLHLLAGRNRKLYVFSELNPRSLTLAKDLLNKNEKRVVVFTGVSDQGPEENLALAEEARRNKMILLKRDICAIAYEFHSKKKALYFFLLSEDEGKNTTQALSLLNRYKKRENTHLYVQSTNLEGELLLSSAEKGTVEVRRIDPDRSLIDRFLYDSGDELFTTARETENGKLISVVLVGLGRCGSNLLKALSWFCQMDGYHLQITAFDQDPLAEETLRVQCPELLSDQYNGVFRPGEAEYRITIHPGVAVGSQAFADAISQLSDTTWVFVALGDDAKNIETAAYLRMLFARSHNTPKIKAIVQSGEKKNALHGLKNFQGQAYEIDFIGDLDSAWSENTVLNSELREKALNIHFRYGKQSDSEEGPSEEMESEEEKRKKAELAALEKKKLEETFRNYEYNYRSSIASAIHEKARITRGIPGAGKTEKEMSPEEKQHLAELEHKRWNVYMRSEGYVFGEPRDDLAKVHPLLVHYDELGEDDKGKDTRIVTS